MNAPNGAFDDIVLVLQPREEARQDTADIIHSDLAGLLFRLIVGQISPQIVRCDMLDTLADTVKSCRNSLAVVVQRLLRAAFYPFCRKKFL